MTDADNEWATEACDRFSLLYLLNGCVADSDK